MYFADNRMSWTDEDNRQTHGLDDDRILPHLNKKEKSTLKEGWIRFRTIGYYTQTGNTK